MAGEGAEGLFGSVKGFVRGFFCHDNKTSCNIECSKFVDQLSKHSAPARYCTALYISVFV